MQNENKTVLIMAGSAGIGMATATRFGKEGFQSNYKRKNRKKLDSIKEEYPEMVTLVSDYTIAHQGLLYMVISHIRRSGIINR